MATKKKLRYFAVYNPDTKEVLFEREVAEDALVTSRVKDHPYPEEKLVDYTGRELAVEVMGRGKPWALYIGAVPFSWDNLTDGVVTEGQKEATE